jgi:EAL domain-containing protein (putative c-di-GMP-specific phosphodiesterase class I)
MPVTAGEIRRALDRGEFRFFYQPKASFLTGQVSGAEALIRWQRDEQSIVLPDAFIPVAHAHGLVPEITQSMFPRLVEDFQRIRATNDATTVALNITAQDLDTPRLLALVREAVACGSISGSQLEIEITETETISGSDATTSSLNALISDGVQLSMDDYGTGYSSLDSLNRLPFGAIKMDQSFVLRMLSSPKSATLVKASVAMAQMLGLKTVIEGIETEGVYNTLLHCGCHEGQGYWISPPLAPDDYLAFLNSDHRWPASPVGMLRMAQLSHTWQKTLLVDAVFAYIKSVSKVDLNLKGLHTGHTECSLGRWYYGVGRSFAGDPDFDALDAPHRAMHDVCEAIFAAVNSRFGLARLKGMLDDLTDNSNRVTASLQRLEARLLMEELAGRGGWTA